MIISWGTGKDWCYSEFIRNWLLANNSLSRLSNDPRFYLGCTYIVIFVQKVLGIFSFNNNGNFMARSLLLCSPVAHCILLGCRDGVVVRALASHQCGPSSIPRSGVKCGLRLLVLYSAPRGFLREFRFLSP